MKYAAFISYRHGDIDEKVAMQIHKQIEQYRIPHKLAKALGKKSVGKVFRDAEELKAASDLSAIIRDALDETEWLIVICTKRFQKSVWCMEEVEYFVQIRGREKIIVVLVEGEPDESFPKILTEIERDGKIVSIEPLAVDIRAESEAHIISNVKKEKFRFLAAMLDVDYDDLRQRQRERKLRAILVASGGVVFATGIFAFVVMWKNFELSNAYTALDNSMQQALRGQSYYLSEYANEAYDNGDRKTAAMLALEALPEDLNNPERPFVSSVMRSLTQAVGVYDYSIGYKAEQSIDMEEEAYDTKVQVSSDNKIILIEKYYYAANNMLKRHIYIYSLEDTKEIVSYEAKDLNRAYYSEDTRCSYLLNDSSTLVYAGSSGITAVDIYTGKTLFTGRNVSELTVSDKEDIIAAIDYEDGGLYSYNLEGELLLECDLGNDIEYTLYDISPDSSTFVLSAGTASRDGILLVDSKNGENIFIDQLGECNSILFSDDDKLCFLRTDNEAEIKHIVEYNIKKGEENYLCDADWNLKNMELSGRNTCFYYHNEKLYEVDNNSGDVIWNYTFASNVISVKSSKGYFGVSCEDGTVYFFDAEKKDILNKQNGNGEPFYLIYMNDTFACLRDYWGQFVRIYRNEEQVWEDVKTRDILEGYEKLPRKWHTCSSSGDYFIMGFEYGVQKTLEIFNADTLECVNDISLSDLGYDSFNNISIDVPNGDYFSIHDYETQENLHYSNDTVEELLNYSENSYYYYNEDGSKIFVTDDRQIIEYDAVTQEVLNTYTIPQTYDKGIAMGDYIVYSSNKSILIKNMSDETETIIEDAELYSFNEEKSVIFYRNEVGTRWYVYSPKDKEILCKGEAGLYSCTMFFGNGRYFLNDYSEVYDMRSWKKVLDISEISNGVYGVETTDEIPYFVVWYQDSEAKSTGKASGSNIAYLYDKKNPEEVVAEIPNYVTTTDDGSVVVYDGAQKLYKVPLYTAADIVKKAKEYVGDAEFSEYQKEQYHIYTE